MKLVVSRCYGGFGLSRKAQEMYAESKGFKIYTYEQTKWKHKDGKDEYRKTTGDAFMSYTLKQDLGDVTQSLDVPSDVWFSSHDLKRDDPDLINIVEKLGQEASSRLAKLEVVEIPDDVNWEISEYDGYESIDEVHRSW
jgi:hypothetical protein